MKALVLSLLMIMGTGAVAQAEEWETPEISPADSRCLLLATSALAEEMNNIKHTLGFQTVFDKEGTPEAIKNFETGESFDFDGIWSTSDDEEFIQFANPHEVFTALMVYSENGPGCDLIHLGNALTE